jgi:hypothetical protein
MFGQHFSQYPRCRESQTIHGFSLATRWEGEFTHRENSMNLPPPSISGMIQPTTPPVGLGIAFIFGINPGTQSNLHGLCS